MKRFCNILCVILLAGLIVLPETKAQAQTQQPGHAPFRYTNPVIHADYSDPDVCEAGGVYYMTASSFNCFPGLPILRSTDLVHWELVNYALTSYPGRNWMEGELGNGRAKGKRKNAPAAAAEDDFHTKVQHGNGVWAPAIRFHDGWFYIFVGDPDRGIFMVRTRDPEGQWEEPVWVVRQKGFIDPCPFWDEDGRAWLSHGIAGSRAGLKSVLYLAPMDPSGNRLLGLSKAIFDGHRTQPTIEGTKLYNHNGRYYLFAPAGGVATGWQTVLRADRIEGPWEERIVMAWAPGTINGPHQGAWVRDAAGADWFLHFQDKGAYGRIVNLQPMTWTADGWPLIGEDPDGDGVGQPVAVWTVPKASATMAVPSGRLARDARSAPPTVSCVPASQELVSGGPLPLPVAGGGHAPGGRCHLRCGQQLYGLPLAWQYPAVPSPFWHMALPDGGVRLFSVEQQERGLWNCPNLLQQKFPAERFTVTARLSFRPNPQLKSRDEEAGFVVMGNDYALLRIRDARDHAQLQYVTCIGASKGAAEAAEDLIEIPYNPIRIDDRYASGNVPKVKYPDIPEAVIWVRLEVRTKAVEGNVPDAVCQFSYSLDGKRYTKVNQKFTAQPEMWTGAKFGFFCNRYSPRNDAGCLDVTDLLVKPEFAPLEGFNYDESAVPEYSLPDLLTTAAGKPVRTASAWENVRRQEVLHLLEAEYGTVPPRPADESWRVVSEGPALGGAAIRREVTVDLGAGDRIHLLLLVPAGRQEPAPCFLGVNFFGNHTITDDPAIALPDTLRYRPDFIVQPRGSQSHRWPLETLIARGYAVVTFCCEDIAPDHDRCRGIRDRYPEYTWGHLAAWGWGLSRALDYLQEGDPDIDGERVAVFGHSRMGKAALWAGARDTRFKMVISNASGCGGAALSRRRFGETVRRINTHYPYWFAKSFQKYNDNEDAMPFDQHFVLALIAPRPLFVESGTEDRWSDPRGEELGLEAALPVYRLYDAEDRAAYGIRPGKHEILAGDWEHYLDFADRFLF